MSGPFAWTMPPPDPDASLAELFSQVTALSQLTDQHMNSPDLRKRSDLRESAYVPRRRHVLTDPAETRKKHAIEMGFNWLTGQMLPAPLEPWTGPPGSERIYNGLMRRTGPSRLQDYGGADLAAIEWLTEEELAAIIPGEDGMVVVPLSDGKSAGQRKYPGAPVRDKLAGIGRQLRGLFEEMVTSAVLRHAQGQRLQRRGARSRRAIGDPDGVPITGAGIAAEVNAEKARRRDLDEYRWASLSRTYEVLRGVIRKLVRLGIIIITRDTLRVRRQRSWRTLPRMAALAPAITGQAPLLPARSHPRERTGQRSPVRQAQRVPHLHLVHPAHRRPRARAPRIPSCRDARPQVARPRAPLVADPLRRGLRLVLTRPRHGGARSGAPGARRWLAGTRGAGRRASRIR